MLVVWVNKVLHTYEGVIVLKCWSKMIEVSSRRQQTTIACINIGILLEVGGAATSADTFAAACIFICDNTVPLVTANNLVSRHFISTLCLTIVYSILLILLWFHFIETF